MKVYLNKMVVLVLAFMLALSMFAVSIAEEVTQGSEASTEKKRIVLIISDDKKDTVLDEYRSQLASAVGILTAVLNDTNTVISIEGVSDGSKSVSVATNEAGAVEKAIEAVNNLEDDRTDDKLDSGLSNKLQKIPQGIDCTILVTNGKYDDVSGKVYRKMEPLSLSNFAIITLKSENEARMKGLAEEFNANYENLQDISVMNLAEQLLQAAGIGEKGFLNAHQYKLAADSEAEVLMENVWGYLAEGDTFVTEKPEGERTVLGMVKDFENFNLKVSVHRRADESETESNTAVFVQGKDEVFVSTNAPEGLGLAWKLRKGEENEENKPKLITPEETEPSKTAANEGGEYVLSPDDVSEDGKYTLILTGRCDELGIKKESKEESFDVVSYPKYAAKETSFTAYDTPNAKNEFVVPSIKQADAFENDDDDQVACSSIDDGYTAEFNKEGYLVITSENTPDRYESEVKLTLAAQPQYKPENGDFSKEQKITVKLKYVPAKIDNMKLECKPAEDKPWYAEGDEIELSINLAKEDREFLEDNSGWGNEVKVGTSPDSKTGLEGDATKGWKYSVPAAKSMQPVQFFINDNNVPAGSEDFKNFEVYTANELTEDMLKGATITVKGLDEEYELNANVSLSVFLDSENIKNAPDWEDEKGKISVKYKVEGGDDLALEGDAEKGWTLDGLKAHKNTSYTFSIFFDDEFVNNKTEELRVKSAPFYIHLICRLNGKEDWEFDNTNGFWRSPDMKRPYIVAGSALALIILMVIIIRAATKQRFKENTSIVITVKTENNTFEGRAVDLEPWGKKVVSLGSLISGSTLPPISLLMDSDVMNKICFKPVRGGVYVTNRSGKLSGGDREVLSRDSNTITLSGDHNILVIIRYE